MDAQVMQAAPDQQVCIFQLGFIIPFPNKPNLTHAKCRRVKYLLIMMVSQTRTSIPSVPKSNKTLRTRASTLLNSSKVIYQTLINHAYQYISDNTERATNPPPTEEESDEFDDSCDAILNQNARTCSKMFTDSCMSCDTRYVFGQRQSN